MTENGRNDDFDVVAMKNVVCLSAVRFEISIGDEASHVCSFSSFLTDDMFDRIFQLSSAGHALWQFTIRQGIKVDVSYVSLSALIFIFKRFFFPFSFFLFIYSRHLPFSGYDSMLITPASHSPLQQKQCHILHWKPITYPFLEMHVVVVANTETSKRCRALVSFRRLCFGISHSFSPCNTHKKIWLVDYENDTNRSWL